MGRSPTARKGPDPAALADRLHSASIRLLRRLRRTDTQTGVSAPRLSALSVLVFGGARSLGDLAAAEQVRPPTMTRIVQALERDGLVRRRPNPTDARGVLLEATRQGRAVLRRGRLLRVAALAADIDSLSARDRQMLARGVQVLERLTDGERSGVSAPGQTASS